MKKVSQISTQRIYEDTRQTEGFRIFTERVWPGKIKNDPTIDEWHKDLAPSENLQEWFDSEEGRYREFKKKYKEELEDKKNLLCHLRNIARKKQVILLHSRIDKSENHAEILKEVLEG